MRRGGFGIVVFGGLGLAAVLTLQELGINAAPVPERESNQTEAVNALIFRHMRSIGGPNEKMPPNAISKALEQRKQLLVERPGQAGIFPASWTWLGPGNIGGRIRGVVIHPTQPSTMWVGGVTGGVWKTTNSGATWVPLDDFLPNMGIGCLAIDKNNPNVLYAGTGEGFAEWPEGTSNTAFVRGEGIFKTTDGGETWNQLASTLNPNFYFVNRIAIDPNNTQILLAGTTTGIFRSTNGGQTWTQTFSGYVFDVRYHPTDSSRAVAGLHDDGALYTTNGGLSWNAATGAVGHRAELAYARSSPSTVYAAVSNNDRILVHRSTNGGQTYTLMTSGTGITTYAAYNSTLWVDPTNPSILILGGVYLYRSTNAGVNFTQTFTNVHADMHNIVEHPGFNGTTNRTAFFATDGGLYRTTDTNGSSTTALNNNLGITQFYGCVVNNLSGVAVGGTQDNGTIRYSGNTNGWTSTFGGDGGYAATDPTDSNYFYGEVQYARIFRSTNGGVSASYIYNNGNSDILDAGGSQTNFIPYFMLDPNDPNWMYVCCRRLWRTRAVKNPQVEWEVVKSAITSAPEPPTPPGAHFTGNSPLNLATVEVAQGNPNLIYVGHNNGQIWKTTNGTATSPTWTRVDDLGGPMPLRWPSKIIVDPNNHNVVYVAFMGWTSDNIWRSQNGGTTWAPIVGSGAGMLPAVPVSALAKHPTEPGWLYAGTEIGIFTSVDDGASWTTDSQGPGLIPVEELHWQNPNTLVAVTHGRGLYRATVNSAADPIAPRTFNVLFGTLLKGQLPWLYLSDDKRIVIDSERSLGLETAIQVVITARSPYPSLSELRFTLEAQASDPRLGQKIELWNFAQQRYDQVSLRFATQADSTVTVSVTNNPNQYINPATGEMRAKVGYLMDTGLVGLAWIAQLDQAYFTAVR